MQVGFDVGSLDDYRTFLRVQSLPCARFQGRTATFPDEYANRLGIHKTCPSFADYEPSDFLFDYQRDISRLAIQKQKYALFLACGLGKTLIETEFALHSNRQQPNKITLIVAPVMVRDQMVDECRFFYGDFKPEVVEAKNLKSFLRKGSGIAITNWEALRDDLEQGNLGAIVADESGYLKSSYGKWGQTLIRLGKGLPWKLCGTGTPAPNDRIEYGNHAVFLDQFPNINSFLAKYFVNRGQTQNRWELKPHALEPFYRSLSHWCIFLNHPATYGWQDNSQPLPEIKTVVHEVPLTEPQQRLAYAGSR